MLAYLQVVRDQTVEQVDIVLAESAEVEELVDGGLLKSQLSEACMSISTQITASILRLYVRTASLLSLVRLRTRGGQAVGAEIFADVGRVGRVIVGIAEGRG